VSASASPPPAPRITLAEARAAGKAAGDANMRAAGRSAWTAEDWDVAAEVTARLLRAAGLPGPEPSRDDA
jgi:hypothetical protein